MGGQAVSVMDKIAVLRLFKASGVTGFASARPLIGLVGWLLASATMCAYYTTAQASSSSVVWNGVLGLHVMEMGMVAIEAMFSTGFFWPLQMLIIGNGTFITFLVTALTGAALAVPAQGGWLSEYQMLCVGSLGVACLSNAMMVAMLFEHLHRCGYMVLDNSKKLKSRWQIE